MPRSSSLILISISSLFLATILFADDQALWREYGLVQTLPTSQGKLSITTWQMKDITGALAAWEWIRPADAVPCDLAPFCAQNSKRTVVADDNYVVAFEGARPSKQQVDALFKSFADKKDTSLPAILTFISHQGLVPNSARYVLGTTSLRAFAPELASVDPGFNQGVEAQVADYDLGKGGKPVRLAIFYYATPEMARLNSVNLRLIPNAHVKRSGVLVAVVFGGASAEQADTLLGRVQYEAKITWNDLPPPSPIKPLYQLLLNILYLSVVLSAICLAAGLVYAGMRLYRRRYGSLDADESMTTLHLTGD
jgi:hypothetical protein